MKKLNTAESSGSNFYNELNKIHQFNIFKTIPYLIRSKEVSVMYS